MSENVVKNKSYQLALDGIFLYKILQERKEYVLSKQFLRSITSVGANTREAMNAQSKADFIHKLSISQKECDEALYWIELLKDSLYISEEEFKPIFNKTNEVLKIIRSIIITSKKSLAKNS
jgi:four helix bundle protein